MIHTLKYILVWVKGSIVCAQSLTTFIKISAACENIR